MNEAQHSRMLKLDLRVVIIALIVAATAVPVEVRSLRHAIIDASASLPDILQNIGGFIPVGVAFSGAGFFAVVLSGLATSCAVELIQLYSLDRFASVSDVLSNVAGAALGYSICRLLRLSAATIPLNRIVSIAAAIAAFGIVAVESIPGKDASFRNWDAQAEFLLGNEATGDRPWYGRVRELAIVPIALDSAVIAELAARPDFSNLAVPPVFGPVKNLDFERDNRASSTPITNTQASYKKIVESGAFTILALLNTNMVYQTGPARIVTNSRDPLHRNFTLAQEDDTFVFRVRTPVSGLNGNEPELQTNSVITENADVFVAASYDGHISRVFVNGKIVARRNLSAAGKPFPALADIHLPGATIVLGMLSALAAIGFSKRCQLKECWYIAAIAGMAGGLLLKLTGGAATVPWVHSWSPLLGLAGGMISRLALARQHS